LFFFPIGIEAMAESHLLQMLETFSKLKVTGLFWERTSGRRSFLLPKNMELVR